MADFANTQFHHHQVAKTPLLKGFNGVFVGLGPNLITGLANSPTSCGQITPSSGCLLLGGDNTRMSAKYKLQELTSRIL